MTSESVPIYADTTSSPSHLPASISRSNDLSPEVTRIPSKARAPTHDHLLSSSGPPMAESDTHVRLEEEDAEEEVRGSPGVSREEEAAEAEHEEARVAKHGPTPRENRVEEDEEKQQSDSSPNDRSQDSSSSSRDPRDSPRHSYTEELQRGEKDITDWDPMQHEPDPEKAQEDVTVPRTIENGGGDDVVDSQGRLIFSDTGSKPSPTVSRKPSHLQLDTKATAAPQPWDLVDPPAGNGVRRDPEFYSTIESRKLHALQNTSCVVHGADFRLIVCCLALPTLTGVIDEYLNPHTILDRHLRVLHIARILSVR